MQINEPRRTLPAAALRAFLFCAGFTFLVMVFSSTSSFLPAGFQRFYYGMLGVVAGFIVTWIFLRFISKTSWDSIGFRPDGQTPLRLIMGFTTGVVIMGSVSLSVIYFSGLRIVNNPDSNLLKFLVSTIAFVPLAYMEEIGFRGYPLVFLKEKAGIRFSILFASLLFAVYHLFNGYNLQDALLGTGTFGILFATGAFYGKGIAFPTAMHYAVNLVTNAFATTAGSASLWLLKPADGTPVENHQTGSAIVWVPQISLLIVALLVMEWIIRKTKIS